MGQFHSDYESELGEVICGTEAIYLTKKVYCVKLLVKQYFDNEGNGLTKKQTKDITKE